MVIGCRECGMLDVSVQERRRGSEVASVRMELPAGKQAEVSVFTPKTRRWWRVTSPA